MKPNSQVDLSIIIPCYNGERYIEPCLNSLFQSWQNNYELIVLDDCSADQSWETLRKLAKKYPQLTVTRLEKNSGPAKARNLGVGRSTGKYLFFLDIDTEVNTDALKRVISFFADYPQAGAFQAQLLSNDRTLETAGHFLSPIGFPYEVGVGQDPKLYPTPFYIFGGRSAALGITRAVFDQIGGFDEDYLIYGEDTDLCWRVWLAGLPVYYNPKVVVRHFQKSSLAQATRSRLFYQGAKNNTSNIIKNSDLLTLVWLLPLHLLGWFLVGLRLTTQKNIPLARQICTGLWWNLTHLPKTLDKRRRRTVNYPNSLHRIIWGKQNWGQLVTQGWRWLTHV